MTYGQRAEQPRPVVGVRQRVAADVELSEERQRRDAARERLERGELIVADVERAQVWQEDGEAGRQRRQLVVAQVERREVRKVLEDRRQCDERLAREVEAAEADEGARLARGDAVAEAARQRRGRGLPAVLVH